MKAAPFEYARADSVAHACELLAGHGDDAKLIAGGQSLVPMMAMRLARPAFLVDINSIAALARFGVPAGDGAFVQFGACARQCALEADPGIARATPLVPKALRWVGHVQTRNRGTIGGSLAHADPSAELPLVAASLDAQITLQSKRGARTLAARDFFAGPMMTAIAPDECLTEVRLPVWREPRTGAAFDEVSIRHGDFAIVAAAAQVALDGEGRCVRAALGIGGAAGTPLGLDALAQRMIGERPDDALIAAIAADVGAFLDPESDLHATREYRLHLARVLADRVLRAARDEALGGGGA